MAIDNLYIHILFACSLVGVAVLITWGMLRFAGILDHPNHRSSHARPVPKSGGVAIVVTFLLGMVFIACCVGSDVIQQRYLLGFVSAATLIATISFIDDIRKQSALFKLATHAVMVGVVLSAGVVIDQLSLPWADSLPSGALGLVLSFFWILGLANACNFMDGIDGLLAGTMLIAGIFFTAISYYQGSSFVYILGYAITAGVLGFLFYNMPPAKIFMGDVGSVFLGFVFAALAIIAARYDASRLSLLVVPMLLLHIIFDTLFTLIRRVLNGQNPLQAHRVHLYQLCVRSGDTHLKVTLMLSGMALLQGLGAVWLVNLPRHAGWLAFIPFLLLQAGYAMLTLRRARKRGVNINRD